MLLAACGDDGGASPDAGVDAGPPVCPAPPLPEGACASDAACPLPARCVAGAIDGADPTPLRARCEARAGEGEPGDPCEAPGDCVSALCGWAGTCLAPCAADGDCEAGACRVLDVRWLAGRAGTARVCAPRFAFPGAVDASVEARGAALRGGPDPVEVFVPGLGALGMAVLEDRCGGFPRPRTLATLANPPVSLYDASATSVGDPPPINPVDGAFPLVVPVPSADRGPASEAGYALGLAVEDDGDLDVTRLVWTPPVPDGPRRLDLDLFYVGPAALAPAGPRGPEAVAAALAEAERLLAPLDLRFGVVRQHLVTGALAESLAIVGVEPGGRRPELERLFGLSAGARGLPVFFIRQFDGGPVGLAGGIPAPLGQPGTPGSGLALAYDVLAEGGAGDVTLGRALAHELGHYLGLFHTTEVTGVVLDPIEDTPICPIELDGSAGDPPDGLLDARECSGGFGAENLMFHAASGESLTTGQTVVLGRGPLYY